MKYIGLVRPAAPGTKCAKVEIISVEKGAKVPDGTVLLEISRAKEVIGYTIDSASDGYNKVLVIFANAEKEITLPEGKSWRVVVDQEIANNESGKTYKGGETITIKKNETLVLFEMDKASGGGCKGCGNAMSFVYVFSALGIYFLFRRRRYL